MSIVERVPSYKGVGPVEALLVSTYSPNHGAAIGESLGPEAIAGHLKGEYEGTVKVSHIDLQLDPDIDALAEQVAQRPPHLLGLSVKIGALPQLDELMGKIQQIPFSEGQKPLIVMGGVVPTFASLELLKKYPDAIMAVKEGEHATSGLVDVIRGDKSLEQVPGICYLQDGGSLVNPLSSVHRRLDLTKRHLPARMTTRRIVDELHGMVWIEGSRGCDFNCTFCSVRELHGGGFDGNMTPESIVEDLAQLERMGIRSMSFTDDDFEGDPERALRIASLIKERRLHISFSIATRADHVWNEGINRTGGQLSPVQLNQHNDRLRHVMTSLHEAGLCRVFLGMESGSPSQLRRYGKMITVEGNYRAIQVLQDIGIDVVAGYIPIDPAMTLRELSENIRFLRETGMYRKVTNPLSVLRVQEGSPYLNLMRAKGLLRERTEDLVFYKVSFLNPSVERIAKLADQWVEDIYMLIFGLKGEVATVTLGPGGQLSESAKTVQNVLFYFKELEMTFIETITAQLVRDPSTNLNCVIEGFQKQRDGLIEQTAAYARSGIFGNNKKLLEAITAIGVKHGR